MVKAFVSAIMFLTRIPMPKVEMDELHWRKSVLFYPVVGLLIGCILYLLALLVTGLASPLLAAVLLVVCWIWLTGGLHLDGWMDLADGLGSNKDREQTLAIMKDSRVGAMGVLSVLCLILIKVGAIYEIFWRGHTSLILLASPLIGRLILIYAIYFFPYISNFGIGDGLKSHLSTSKIIFQTIIVFIFLFYIFDGFIVLISIAAIILGLMFLHFVSKKLDGLNGDVYGASAELTEVIVLLLIAIFWR